MQLGSPGRLATSLFAATAALLGAPTGPSAAEEAKRPWTFDTSLLFYGESQRVSDLSANVRAQHGLGSGLLTLRLTVDSLTGASASGAVPSRFPQTFTTPSGNGSYQAGPGATPLDTSFLDTRVAFGANWLRSVGTRGELDFGLSGSKEYDYLHTGANARYSLAFDQRNTTLGIGLAFASDTVDPVGGAPVGLTPMRAAGQPAGKLGSDSKRVTDLLLGVTQVLGPRTVGELSYSFSRSDGYLTDPYKVLTVVDPATGDPVPGPDLPYLYLFEDRPDSRTKHSLYAQVKHRFGRPVADASYRYMTDDWGVTSHTLEMHWRQPIGPRWFVQPHLRYYVQSAADFYRPFLVSGQPLPDHASADYRLGELDAATLGVKVGRALAHDREVSLRVEYYRPSGRAPPLSAFGAPTGLDIDPAVDAVITQLAFRF